MSLPPTSAVSAGAGVRPPPIDAWSRPLLGALETVVGDTVRYAQEPAAREVTFGPWAYALRLERDDGWGAPLVARLAWDRRMLDREAAAMRLSTGHGCGAPAVRCIVALEADSAHPLWALVSDAPDGMFLPELLGWNVRRSGELLRGFGAHHAALHRLPVSGLIGEDALPVISAPAEVARIDAAVFPAERAWLDAHLPPPAEPVLCHGGYHPLCVFGPPPEQWDEHGGPGRGLTAVNWGGAVLAPAAFDVAFTLIAFWIAPYFAASRAERAQVKMLRDRMLNTYTLGYTGYRELDPAHVRFWRAFHALRGVARAWGAYAADGSPFAPQDRGALPDELGPALERHFGELRRVR